MQTSRDTAHFSDTVATVYQQHLVPLIFAPHAADLAARIAARPLTRLLELAAGTGVLTRELAARLAPDVQIIATDINQAMLGVAQAQGTARAVEWRQVDAMALPFPDASFDAVVCQFGVMFFPDKAGAFGEMHRVLRPGGTLLFNVWDRVEANDFARVVNDVLASRFAEDPSDFVVRLPHGYFSADAIVQDLAQAGFIRQPNIETVTAISRADTPRAAALAYCQGTPLRGEIESRDPAGLEEATAIAADAIAQEFGRGPVIGRIQALVVQVSR